RTAPISSTAMSRILCPPAYAAALTTLSIGPFLTACSRARGASPRTSARAWRLAAARRIAVEVVELEAAERPRVDQLPARSPRDVRRRRAATPRQRSLGADVLCIDEGEQRDV